MILPPNSTTLEGRWHGMRLCLLAGQLYSSWLAIKFLLHKRVYPILYACHTFIYSLNSFFLRRTDRNLNLMSGGVRKGRTFSTKRYDLSIPSVLLWTLMLLFLFLFLPRSSCSPRSFSRIHWSIFNPISHPSLLELCKNLYNKPFFMLIYVSSSSSSTTTILIPL